MSLFSWRHLFEHGVEERFRLLYKYCHIGSEQIVLPSYIVVIVFAYTTFLCLSHLRGLSNVQIFPVYTFRHRQSSTDIYYHDVLESRSDANATYHELQMSQTAPTTSHAQTRIL